MIYTEKQRELLRLWQKRQLQRINLLEGSVSSGKTWVSLVLWAFWVASMPQSKPYLMCGKSLITLKRNCLLLLQELVGESNFVFSVPAKEGYLFGRRVFLEGANDARSESKIRGMTLQGAYCDELTQFPEDFFAMLLSRLRLPGAKLIATTNPDAPLHWLKAKYIDRADELDFLDIKFTLDDNTTLPRDYVENLKREYTGVFYSRFILGNWTKAEGLVYPMFDMDKHVVNTLPERSTRHRYYISVDYGVSNPFASGLYDYDPIEGRAVKIKELYYKGGSANRVDNEAYYKMLRDFIGDYMIEYIIIDPSASSMIETIQKYAEYMVVPADNDVLNGIQDVTKFINTGSLLFYKDCVETFKEFGAYSWDEKKTEDAVIKENDHAMDEVRYFCRTALRNELKWIV